MLAGRVLAGDVAGGIALRTMPEHALSSGSDGLVRGGW